MNEDMINKMTDDLYEDSKEDTLFAAVSSFYGRKMRSVFIVAGGLQTICCLLAAWCVYAFFSTDEMARQIMYSASFVCLIQICAMQSIWGWQWMHRHSIKREVKRLELRIAELSQIVKGNHKEVTQELSNLERS
jgi:hypothetical protein